MDVGGVQAVNAMAFLRICGVLSFLAFTIFLCHFCRLILLLPAAVLFWSLRFVCMCCWSDDGIVFFVLFVLYSLPCRLETVRAVNSAVIFPFRMLPLSFLFPFPSPNFPGKFLLLFSGSHPSQEIQHFLISQELLLRYSYCFGFREILISIFTGPGHRSPRHA